jgi:2-C-methyl-D-erythritol 4-phosphate cytidylyltransferase
VVAAPPGHEAEVEVLLGELAGAEGGAVVTGGPSRAESVRFALARVESELVVVHDAARPLAPPALVDAVLARLEADADADGVIAASRVVDTVKRVEAAGAGDGAAAVAETLDRDLLWAAQTPQAFRTAFLRGAQERAAERGELADLTDEAMAVELAGGRVLVEEGPPENMKVTSAVDLRVAEALLAARG